MSAIPYIPASRSLDVLRAAAAECHGCPRHCRATQTVFGEGPPDAELMLVGKEPGFQEDRAGRVFVGRAGHELDRVLDAIGIARGDIYITNIVKHFDFEQRGSRRIRRKSKHEEARACTPWLRAELEAVSPRVLVILGATAGRSLLGERFRLGAAQGQPIESDLAELVLATTHPSAILRVPNHVVRARVLAELERDLRTAVEYLRGRSPGSARHLRVA